MQYRAGLLLWLAACAAAYQQPDERFAPATTCFQQPEACLSAFGSLAYGFDESKETVWQWLHRKTAGCEDLFAPLAERTPPRGFRFNTRDGSRALTCLRQVPKLNSPSEKEVNEEFIRRSSEGRREARRAKRRSRP